MEHLAISAFIVDSDIVIDFLRRRADWLPQLLTQYQGYLTAVSIYELEVVAVRSERQVTTLEQLLQQMEILPLDKVSARYAAQIQRELKQQGQLIGLPDTLIAGIGLAQNLPLLTRNLRHYQRIASLQVLTAADVLPTDSN